MSFQPRPRIEALGARTVSLAGVVSHLPAATVKLFRNESKAVSVTRLAGIIEQKQIDEKKRTISGYITTIDCDRQGDVVIPKGMNTAPYMANPVVLMNHDYRSKPVAKAVSLDADDYGVRAVMEFADSADAVETWELVKGGFLNAFSVGFVADAVIEKSDARFDGVATAWRGFTKSDVAPERFITRSTLLEVSIVPVPCNASALIDQISKGVVVLSKTMQKQLRLDLPAIEVKQAEKITIQRAVFVERHFDTAAFIGEQVKKELDRIRGRIA